MFRRFNSFILAASVNPAASSHLQDAAAESMAAAHGGLVGDALAAGSKKSADEQAAAQRLKCGCNEILAKYQNVPPEVFLKRARAYEELSQPYFALADYSMASESVQVDKQHVTKLMKETKELPEEIRISYPGSNTHLHHQVTPFLSNSVKVSKSSDLGGGRSVIALENIKSHDVIIKRHQPWISYPAFDSHCASCGERVGQRIIPCSNPDCHEEYCSRDCRTHALTFYHGGTCTNDVFRTLELELYSKFKSGNDRTQQNEAMLHLIALRIVSTGLTQKIKPTALAEVQTLSGSVLASPVQIATSMHEFHYRLCRAANMRTSLSLEEFMCLMCKIQSNLFQDDNTFYLSLPRSMINHSCSPNCSELGGQIVALEPISRGEEITISYFPSLVGVEREQRLLELKKRGFECRCALCLSGK